ncbi:MAG: nuclear transport factor 2 family protein [Gammaproteobacteria bacterium]
MTDAHERNLALAHALLARMSAGDFAGLAGLVTEDFVFDVPYVTDEAARPPHGRDAVIGYFNGVMKSLFAALELTPDEAYPGRDPDVLCLEYHSRGVLAANGAPYRNRYLGVFRFRSGRVALWREFFNPEELTRALAGPAR